jgi:hypothetical protein
MVPGTPATADVRRMPDAPLKAVAGRSGAAQTDISEEVDGVEEAGRR